VWLKLKAILKSKKYKVLLTLWENSLSKQNNFHCDKNRIFTLKKNEKYSIFSAQKIFKFFLLTSEHRENFIFLLKEYNNK
jgi:hypothetical protein